MMTAFGAMISDFSTQRDQAFARAAWASISHDIPRPWTSIRWAPGTIVEREEMANLSNAIPKAGCEENSIIIVHNRS